MFPNFRAVIDFLRAGFALADRGRRSLAWTPLLLDGPPGIGKTYFAEELAKRLATPSRRLDMSVTATAMSLVGCDMHYDESPPGLLFELLAFGTSASPLVILDELDKGEGDSRYPATSPLHGLLEPRTAAEFRDQAFPDIRLDARHVLWVATSNAADLVPGPIRSRMRVFRVGRPVPQAARALARRIFIETGKESLPGVAIPEPNDGILDLLVGLSPRTVQLVVREAFGRAIYAERELPVADDFTLPEEQRPNIGF